MGITLVGQIDHINKEKNNNLEGKDIICGMHENHQQKIEVLKKLETYTELHPSG